jgi:hypothetical protein
MKEEGLKALRLLSFKHSQSYDSTKACA